MAVLLLPMVEAGSVVVGHLRTVVAEVMRLPTEAVAADTPAAASAEAVVMPLLRAVAVATAAEAAIATVAVITDIKA